MDKGLGEMIGDFRRALNGSGTSASPPPRVETSPTRDAAPDGSDSTPRA
jgi:hypothetical protein